jgi:hypothetical protein
MYGAFPFNKGSLDLLLDCFEMKESIGGKTKMYHFPMSTSYVVSYGNFIALKAGVGL